MNDNIKKALSLVAFGFLLTLVNLNLKYNNFTINITPEFVGWILFFLAFDKLGDYGKGKEYIKWISLLLVIATAAFWVLDMAMPQLDTGIYKTGVSLVEAYYIFVLFGMLTKIAEDCGSNKAGLLSFLKYLNIILILLFAGVGYYTAYNPIQSLVVLSTVIGMAALVSAIVTCIVLFGLRKDVNREN